jgi:hypothetical protein
VYHQQLQRLDFRHASTTLAGGFIPACGLQWMGGGESLRESSPEIESNHRNLRRSTDWKAHV